MKTVTTLGLLAVVWHGLAPAWLGGPCEYVIIAGNSMEPSLRRGDLAILRLTHDYQVGDVVTYEHPVLGPVIHRVVAREGEYFVLQGDHNTWLDSYKPVEAEIVGELWFWLPYAGNIAYGFKTPLGAALLAGAIGILLLWPDADPGLTRQQADRLAGRLKAIAEAFHEMPLLLTQNGTLIARAGAISPAAATAVAQRAARVQRKEPTRPAHAWLCLKDLPVGSSEQRDLVLYSVRISRDTTLLAAWDGNTSQKLLRASALKAAEALRSLL